MSSSPTRLKRSSTSSSSSSNKLRTTHSEQAVPDTPDMDSPAAAEHIPRNSIDKKGKGRMSAVDHERFPDADSNTTASNKFKGDGDGSRRMTTKGNGKLALSAAEKWSPSAFSRLPKEIMQQILYFCSPNEFDSLTLLNSSWYQASRSCMLYAEQLSYCGITTPKDLEDTPENLKALVHKFSRASRRGLFETMLQPEKTEIRLICRSLSSFAAGPGGEIFKYEFSPRGTYLLAISSSRMIVIDTTTPSEDLPVTVKRELRIMRRPLSAAILDDGSLMAVLSSEHKVNVYDLKDTKVQRTRTVDLDNAPRAIALAPGGTVLAVAYDGGVEVISLEPGFDQKREVKCDLVDSLCFSLDGTVLIGSTLSSTNPATVIISAPFFSDVMEGASLCQMWTTQILFPRTSRDNSHATLLAHHGDTSSWTFTYDKAFSSFRAVMVDDLRNGHTYFSAPTENPLPPTVLPAASSDGGVVASGFGSKAVWIYGVPNDLEIGEGSIESTNSAQGSSRNSLHIGATFVPQWQSGVDRTRNTFVQGKKIEDVKGLAGLKFTITDKGERLIAVAGGFETDETEEGMDMDSEILEGGRLILFNFSRTPSKGAKTVITTDVGDGSHVTLEKLEEQQTDIEAEVNIVRRRTLTQRQRDRPLSIIGAPPVPSLPAGVTSAPVRSSTTIARPSASRRTSGTSNNEDDDEGPTLSEALEWSYSHTDPRSHVTLQRAATAARANAERTPRRRPGADPGPNYSVTNYRLLGLREEEWVEPPPPYVENLTAVPLYDYESRLMERARSMGIMNPNERVRRRSSVSELDMDRRDRDSLASGASSPRFRRNAPSLRITSPVSPGGGGLSRNGSVSAGPTSSFQGFSSQLSPRGLGLSQSDTSSVPPVPQVPSMVSNQSTVTRPTTASSRRSSIQREPVGGVLSTGSTESLQNPPSNRQSLQSNSDSMYTSSPVRPPRTPTTPTSIQQNPLSQGQGRFRHRQADQSLQRAMTDELSDTTPPLPAIPNQFRSNSMPMQNEAIITPARPQRPTLNRPQSAILSPGSGASFAHSNSSIISLPNFDSGNSPRSPGLPQAQRLGQQPPSSSAGRSSFNTQSPSHPQFTNQFPPARSRPETPTQQNPQQLQPQQSPPQQRSFLSRLPSHRQRKPEDPLPSPALSIPSTTSASQPVTPVAPLNLPVNPATAPVTPVVPRENINSSRPMMPVSAMVAQTGPPPSSSGSGNNVPTGVGHPQFRTAMSGNNRNTLSLTVSPPRPQAQQSQFNNASSSAAGSSAVNHPPATRSGTTKRTKSRGRKAHQYTYSGGYVNPAFLPVPGSSAPQPGSQALASLGAGQVHAQTIERPLPSPGRRVSTRRSPLHGGFHAAAASSSSSVNNLQRNASRAERSAARAANSKKKRGWGRKKDNDEGEHGMDESYEVVRKGSGHGEQTEGGEKQCSIM